MAESFCSEHSNVMLCLGRLEEGQKNLQATADSTKIKVDVILSRQLDGLIVNTTERTKLGILFWFLMVCGVAMISSLVSFLMKKLGV